MLLRDLALLAGAFSNKPQLATSLDPIAHQLGSRGAERPNQLENQGAERPSRRRPL